MKFVRTLAFTVAVFALPSAAFASSSYPVAVRNKLGLNAAPPCTLCHGSNQGGLGTVVKAFGKAFQAAGGRANLEAGLDKLAAEGTDSDQDGVGDIAELKAGRDPNVADGPTLPDAGTPPADSGAPGADAGKPTTDAGTTTPPPAGGGDSGGCSTSPVGSTEGAFGAFAVALGLVLARRRRAR